MKILIDARLYGVEHSGLGRYTMGLVEGLAKLDKTNNYRILLRKKYFNRLKLPNNWKKHSVDIQHYSIKEQLLLPIVISQQKSDIFHALNPNISYLYTAPYLLRASKYKPKLILTVHDTIQLNTNLKATTLPLPVYYFKNLGYKMVFKKAVTNADRVIAPTNYVRKDVIEKFNIDADKVSVIKEGVSIEQKRQSFRRSLKSFGLKKPYFIYIGNAYPHKNLKRAIEATAYLNNKLDQSIQLAIVSSRNVFTKRLARTIKELEGEKIIKLLGFVPDNELSYLLNNSCAFVYPSLYEGFGLPGLEAMQSGTLVLASDIPVFKEVYKNKAIYFNPHDFTSIAKAMEESLSLSISLRKDKIEKANKFVQRYSWRKMALETLKVYNEAFK